MQTALIKLTIGDPSGSHSERYQMKVGIIEHQSPDFGLVVSNTYTFLPGNYTIKVEHIKSNLSPPDYDYVAKVQKVSGSATVTVVDNFGILGYHYESHRDYALGKTALLIVDTNCPKTSTECSCLKTCTSCKENSGCIWATNYCREKRWFEFDILNYCSCNECLEWYNKEMEDTTWLHKLNQEYKCPCRVRSRSSYWEEIDNPSNKKWDVDWACLKNGIPACFYYHDGANGCLRSNGKTTDGARQQCCYDSSGRLIKPGLTGAGTPDRSTSDGHHTYDVKPFETCCKDCNDKSRCDLYINGVRKGDDSHCAP